MKIYLITKFEHLSNCCLSFIQIDAQVIKTDSGMRYSLSPEKRKCYFPDEYSLKIYSEYSYDNCIHECRLLKAYDQFKCLPWNQPSISTRQVLFVGKPLLHEKPTNLLDFSSICIPSKATWIKEFMNSNISVKIDCNHCLADCASTIITSKLTSGSIRR